MAKYRFVGQRKVTTIVRQPVVIEVQAEDERTARELSDSVFHAPNHPKRSWQELEKERRAVWTDTQQVDGVQNAAKTETTEVLPHHHTEDELTYIDPRDEHFAHLLGTDPERFAGKLSNYLDGLELEDRVHELQHAFEKIKDSNPYVHRAELFLFESGNGDVPAVFVENHKQIKVTLPPAPGQSEAEFLDDVEMITREMGGKFFFQMFFDRAREHGTIVFKDGKVVDQHG